MGAVRAETVMLAPMALPMAVAWALASWEVATAVSAVTWSSTISSIMATILPATHVILALFGLMPITVASPSFIASRSAAE